MTKNTGVKSFALVVSLFLLLSWLQLDPGSSGPGSSGEAQDVRAGDEIAVDEEAGDLGTEVVDEAAGQSGTAGPATRSGGGGTGGGTAKTADPKVGATSGQLACERGKNGGATDTGVTGNKIRLATTAVLDGPAKSLLEPSVTGMKAVIDKVNQQGGICGRQLDLAVFNDGFNSETGLRYIKNFIAEGYFALPVVPSAEGLGLAISSKEIAKAGIPVVGTDGMREEQYSDPWVWPVASATVTAMRVMAKYAHASREARTFGIVWDTKYQFGREGKDAFVQQVKALGGTITEDRIQGLDPDAPSYATEADRFNNGCGNGKCDMVALLLLPETAKKWFARQPATGRLYTAGAQTLFTDRFAQDCVQAAGARCQDIAVWTGYNPPIGSLAASPGVAGYVQDVRALSPGIDVNNQFLEGAYLGMTVFVEALRKVGPELTRARLRAVLDSMDYTSDLVSTLSWRPGKHSANVRAQAFALTMSQGTFRGWRNEQTGFIADPAHEG